MQSLPPELLCDIYHRVGSLGKLGLYVNISDFFRLGMRSPVRQNVIRDMVRTHRNDLVKKLRKHIDKQYLQELVNTAVQSNNLSVLRFNGMVGVYSVSARIVAVSQIRELRDMRIKITDWYDVSLDFTREYCEHSKRIRIRKLLVHADLELLKHMVNSKRIKNDMYYTGPKPCNAKAEMFRYIRKYLAYISNLDHYYFHSICDPKEVGLTGLSSVFPNAYIAKTFAVCTDVALEMAQSNWNHNHRNFGSVVRQYIIDHLDRAPWFNDRIAQTISLVPNTFEQYKHIWNWNTSNVTRIVKHGDLNMFMYVLNIVKFGMIATATLSFGRLEQYLIIEHRVDIKRHRAVIDPDILAYLLSSTNSRKHKISECNLIKYIGNINNNLLNTITWTDSLLEIVEYRYNHCGNHQHLVKKLLKRGYRIRIEDDGLLRELSLRNF